MGAPSPDRIGVGADADGSAGAGRLDDAGGVGALASRSGGQESSWIFSVARSTNSKRVARGLAGSETMMREMAFGTRLGASCNGRRVTPGEIGRASCRERVY